MEPFVRLFMQCMDIGYQAGIAVLFLLGARAFFSFIQVPKKYICMLWLIPFLRLAFPIQPESVFCILPKQDSFREVMEETIGKLDSLEYAIIESSSDELMAPVSDEPMVLAGDEPVASAADESVVSAGDKPMVPAGDEPMVSAGDEPIVPAGDESMLSAVEVSVPDSAELRQTSWALILTMVWLAGAAVLGIFGLASMGRLRRRLRMSVKWKENIYLADDLPGAFVLGIFRPRIYLPSNIAEEAREYVIAHERAHIKRRDHISKLAAYILLCIYWMNPLLWAGSYFFRKDVEIACDEAVIGRQNESYRKNYAKALLELSLSEESFRGMPLAFAEESPKERIIKVMEYQKPKLAAAVVGVLLLAALAVGLLTNPVKKEPGGANGIGEAAAGNKSENEAGSKNGAGSKSGTSENGSADSKMDDSVQGERELTEESAFRGESYAADSAADPKADPEALAAETQGSAFEAPKLHYYIPQDFVYAYVPVDAKEEEALHVRAQKALQEMYDLIGYPIGECCYYYVLSTDSFCFGMTEDDLEYGRIFYSRYYHDIQSMDLASRRRVWYSPIDMIRYPEGYDTMTEKEKAIWFVLHSGMYNGQPAADAYQPYDWDLNIWRIVMADDTAYEITLDSEADLFGSIYGPYPNSDIQH